MARPRLDPDEQRRLEALHRLCLLDTPPEERFDRLTRLAQALFDVPIALISLVDSDRQWFKSKLGLAVDETPREISFCTHAIQHSSTLVVEDARQDPRFATNPLVTGDPGIRFYAGRPLQALDGSRVGTLCIVDRKPRPFREEQLRRLEDLAGMIERELNHLHAEELIQRHDATARELDRFFSMSLDMLCIATFEGHFKKLNPVWSKVLGYTNEELCSKPFIDFVHPEDRDNTIEEAQRLIEGGVTALFENRYRCKDGRWRRIHWNATPDPQNKLIYAVARDVTALRFTHQQLREALEMAKAASRSKTNFLANMSHELRTPLNSVIGFTNILLKNQPGNLEPEQISFLERIRDNGVDLLELINEILDLAKIESGARKLEYEAVDLAALVKSVIQQHEVLARQKGLDLLSETPEGLEPLWTDRGHLKQILINLVGNALKFTEDGCVVLRLVAAADGRTPARIEVEDTGIGIPPGQMETVFEAFARLEGGLAQVGTGLGLAISRTLAQQLGYGIEVESAVGKGTCFQIVLGLRRPRAHLAAPGGLSAAGGPDS